MARGEDVRHVTLDHRQLFRGGILGGLAALVIGGLAFYGLQGEPTRAVPTETVLRQSYETRLANLRNKLDEATSRQFVAQKMVETKVDALLTQQEIIAERYERLEPIFERARDNGILPEFTKYGTPIPTPRPSDDFEAANEEAEHPHTQEAALQAVSFTAETVSPRGLKLRESQEDNLLDPFETASLRRSTFDLSADALSGFGRAIDYAEIQQITNMKALTTEAVERSMQIASVLSSFGIETERDTRTALGGPYEPVPEDAGFETHYDELENALDRLEGLRGVSEKLPFAAPMASNLMSSRFGIRSDPFLRRRALHAGIDYAARSGTPIRSTAAGTIVRAGRSGGYGNLVEIDHGNGIKTRFGHMARIDVEVGDEVPRGAQLGTVGSTGRSTGPHLHYEVRRNGRAIDPMRFIRAGREIAGLS
ncbi:probable metalloendopeptidase protein [Fulvimarina pelagi HTCC2506]|uniref:Probable metalloendopeptidase protein n=2 Tax=Fulvimarina pelagi TaxID=217511 RepID=Q0G700_9HYPH|nr:probable metalloendopeptidase protein [Fulvimarina pelagi HTCC2506]